MQIIDEHDQHRDTLMKEQLENLGIQLRIAHFQGDSSYPTEYTLRYSFVSAVGPTFDLAIAAFIEQLLKHVPVERALTEEEQKIVKYNAEMDERNRIAYENRPKPWLPGNDE
jgi:hypothetical protein